MVNQHPNTPVRCTTHEACFGSAPCPGIHFADETRNPGKRAVHLLKSDAWQTQEYRRLKYQATLSGSPRIIRVQGSIHPGWRSGIYPRRRLFQDPLAHLSAHSPGR